MDRTWINQSKIEGTRQVLAKAKAMLKAVQDGTYIDPRGAMPTRSTEDLDPCSKCGRVVYAGRCCNG